MKHTAIVLFFSFFVILSAAGCYAEAYAVTPHPVIVAAPPPQTVIHEEHPGCPTGYVWVNDYYHWNGSSWVIVGGECASRPGYVWVAPVYIKVQGGVKYVSGYWKPVSTHHHVKAGTPHPKVKAQPK